MFVINSREELRELLFRQVSILEPEMAEGLTDMIMGMDEEDVVPLVGDDDALKRLVKRITDGFLGRVMTLDDEVVDSDDAEWIPTPPSSGSSDATWSPTPESTIQRAAMITEREDAYYRVQRGNDIVPWSSGITENPDPRLQVLDDALRKAVEERPAESTYLPEYQEFIQELTKQRDLMANNLERVEDQTGGFVESTRDPAQSNTMKEVVASSASLPCEGTQTEAVQHSGPRNPLASTSTVSYVLGANREGAAPSAPESQKEDSKSTRKTPRASKRDAADHSHPLAETEPPASMPQMEAVRQAERPRRTSRHSRTSQPAYTDVRGEEVDAGKAEAAVGGFLCGVLVATCCILTCS